MQLDNLSQLKKALYIDKVYHGIALLSQRSYEKPLDLSLSELRIFSQNGEDGIIYDLFKLIVPDNPSFVEFGVGDGWSCNTRLLAQVMNWQGFYYECSEDDFLSLSRMYMHSSRISCFKELLTPSNVLNVFKNSNIPDDLTLLSIDIDGQDFWVGTSILSKYSPQVLILEYNSVFSPGLSAAEALASDSNPQTPNLTGLWGVSSKAWNDYLVRRGYVLLHYELAGVNVFYVRQDIFERITPFISASRISQPSPNFGLSGQYHSSDLLYPNGIPCLSRNIITNPSLSLQEND
jgi:hypothetical protein